MKIRRINRREFYIVTFWVLIATILDINANEKGFLHIGSGQDRVITGTVINTEKITHTGRRIYKYFSIVRYKEEDEWKEAEVPRAIGDRLNSSVKLIITPTGECMRAGWIWAKNSFLILITMGLWLLLLVSYIRNRRNGE